MISDIECEVIDMEAEERLEHELITKKAAFDIIAMNNGISDMTLRCYDALIAAVADCPAVDAEMDVFIYAFKNVVWYNGYIDDIKTWIKRLREEDHPCLMDEIQNIDETYYQLQVLSMMLVTMFGDYGASPRFGWIVKQEECINFLNKVMERVTEC